MFVKVACLLLALNEQDRGPRPEPEPGFKRVVMCSGKVFYELHARREELGKMDEVALVRVEQLAPFPFDLVMREIRRYPNAEFIWCQEEPMNMGAYFYVAPRIETCLRLEGRTPPPAAFPAIKYAGREPSASTATGFPEVHAQEQAKLLNQALDLSF